MHEEITGIILAGGRATRMGGEDKGLVPIADIPLYQYVLARLRPQVGPIAINANRNQARYRESGLALLHTSLATPLEDYLARGERKLMLFLDAARAQQVEFKGQQSAFHNINTLEDCQRWVKEKGIIHE